jgi:hypothetical protein
LRFGQAALVSGHVVTIDSYSYSAAHEVWLNHEWLSEIVMALAYNGLGIAGLKLWKFVCVAATIVLTDIAMTETGASPTIQLNLLGLAALAMIPQNQFRPQLFTFMLLAAMLALLARYSFRGRAPLWLLIPIMALWGNLHGGFIVGIATLIAYTGVVCLQDLTAGRGLARTYRLGLITLAGTLATLISPYGFNAWRVVLNALGNYAAHPIIADWQPLLHATIAQWRMNPPTVIFFVAGIAIMAAFTGSVLHSFRVRDLPYRKDLPLAAVAAMMTAAAFVAVRNMPLAVIACMPPLAYQTELIAARRLTRKLMRSAVPTSAMNLEPDASVSSSRIRSSVNPWFATSVAIALALLAGLFSARLAVDVHEYPVGAISFMRQHNLHGNILNDFGWGQYLIWKSEPESKVFIDGRYDTIYPAKVINEYLDFISAKTGVLKILGEYPHDLVLIPLKAPAVKIMNATPGWKLIYQDGNALLFARADSAAARLPGAPIEGTLPSASVFP